LDSVVAVRRWRSFLRWIEWDFDQRACWGWLFWCWS